MIINRMYLGPSLPKGSCGNMSVSPMKVGMRMRFSMVSLYLAFSCN